MNGYENNSQSLMLTLTCSNPSISVNKVDRSLSPAMLLLDSPPLSVKDGNESEREREREVKPNI